jgi:hypothetical protein
MSAAPQVLKEIANSNYNIFIETNPQKKNNKKVVKAFEDWQSSLLAYADATKNKFGDQSFEYQSSLNDLKLASIYGKTLDSNCHKNKMACGVAISVIITAVAIALIVVALFFPPAGLTASALTIIFGVAGSVGSLSLLGIIRYSIRLGIDKFRINICAVQILIYNKKHTRKDLAYYSAKRAGIYSTLDDIMAPWRPIFRQWKKSQRKPTVVPYETLQITKSSYS